MTPTLCALYLVANWATWSRSETDSALYLRRVLVSAAFVPYLLMAGDVERYTIGLLAELAVAFELIMFAFACDARDPRIYEAFDD